jgi:hypothetical protein
MQENNNAAGHLCRKVHEKIFDYCAGGKKMSSE